jgi:hypothetical protein
MPVAVAGIADGSILRRLCTSQTPVDYGNCDLCRPNWAGLDGNHLECGVEKFPVEKFDPNKVAIAIKIETELRIRLRNRHCADGASGRVSTEEIDVRRPVLFVVGYKLGAHLPFLVGTFGDGSSFGFCRPITALP